MIPRTITFNEIQQGDKIRVTVDDIAFEGVADRLRTAGTTPWWMTESGKLLAHSDTNTITLLDRPSPPLPQEQGAPITVYRYRSDSGYEYDVERVMIREGVRFRDMSGQRLEDDQIIAWAPLTVGERVTR